MGRITEQIQRYSDGAMTLVDLTASLSAFHYRAPPRYAGPRDPVARLAWVDDHLYDDPTDTTEEITRAMSTGLLSPEDHNAIQLAISRGVYG